MHRYIYTIIFTFSASVAAKEPVDLYRAGEIDKAIEQLKVTEPKGPSQVAMKNFALGVWSHELERWKEANQYLLQSRENDTSRDAYVYFLKAIGHKEMKELAEAKKYFGKTLSLHPSSLIKYESRFQLGEVAVQEGHYKTAYKHMKYLERKWRYGSRHPEVLWRLIKIDTERNRKWRTCKWAKKLYSKYPSHPLIYDWGIDLRKAKFEGKELGCLESKHDRQSRINRLQWAGESVRARKELDQLRKNSDAKEVYDTDVMFVNYLIREGFVDEALKLVLNHHKDKQKDFDYLMLLAKAASRAGEFQTAVGAYYKAYQTKPKGRQGRRALFRAAFLSYQFQDYDGATRKFEEFVNTYRRSGLRRDAQWHLAWLKYLRGDYDGAIRSFKYVLLQKKRYWRRWTKYPSEKINFWMAMSYLRSGQNKKAQELFVKIMDDPLLGYYSLAAQHRYNSIPGVAPIKSLSQFDRELASFNDTLAQLDVPVVLVTEGHVEPVSEENESEENLQSSDDELTSDDPESKGVAEKEPEDEEEPEQVSATIFKNPRLQQAFERAHQLIAVGKDDWAKWELYEIEKRTRNHEYLRRLTKAYEKIGSYNRSSYIGAIYFSAHRKKKGLEGARDLWEVTYPRAYEEHVLKNSKQFSVPVELIWGIMRAESNYRKDVVSAVGAKGLMQIMPNTARQVARLMGDKDFHVRRLGEPADNIRIGTRYLHRLLKKFDRHVPLAAGGYNAGPHRVESWLSTFGNLDMDEFIEHIPFIETRNYVKKVTRYYAVYNLLYNKGSKSLTWLSKPIPFKVAKRPSPRETWEAIE